MKIHTKESRKWVTPNKAIRYLKEGNKRFVNKIMANRDFRRQVNERPQGQFPFAVIHGIVAPACKGVELGNITPLLKKIKPAISSRTIIN